MKKIIKEPFVHFIGLGILLFVLYGMVNKTDSKDTIIINDFDVKSIISSWEMQWKRYPTEKELEKLINLNIKQEVFYQEALKMNLDHNDEIIKRRLAQKMQFLSNDIAAMVKPTDDDLEAYYKKNIKNYSTPITYSLYQITFSTDNRKDNYADATAILEQFPEATVKEMENKGDELPFSYFFKDVDVDELALQLGRKFPEALATQSSNKWTGPIPSGFGYHLVYITKNSPPQPKPFNQVEKSVIRDYEYDKQQNIDKNIYQELKKKYNIKLDIQSEEFDPKFVTYLENIYNN